MAFSAGEKHNSGGWPIQLGIALILLGALALCSMLADGASVMLLSWLVVVRGVVETAHAFYVHKPAGFLLHLAPGIAAFPIGLLVAVHPSAGEFAWMLLFAYFFTLTGLFRILAAVRLRFASWKWAAFDGAVTLLLGAPLWAARPWLGTWYFSFAVGISFMLGGWSSIIFAGGLRQLGAARRARLSSRENKQERVAS